MHLSFQCPVIPETMQLTPGWRKSCGLCQWNAHSAQSVESLGIVPEVEEEDDAYTTERGQGEQGDGVGGVLVPCVPQQVLEPPPDLLV